METISDLLNKKQLEAGFNFEKEGVKVAFIKYLGLFGAFREDSKSEIIDDAKVNQILSEESTLEQFNQKYLQKIYQHIRPAKEGGDLVERRDMRTPEGLAENISQINLANLMAEFGAFEESKLPPDLSEKQLRIVINGATQKGCQNRINYVKGLIEKLVSQDVNVSEIIIDLATGVRDLWPDNIGEENWQQNAPDAMLVDLLVQKTDKDSQTIIQDIVNKRKEVA